MARRCPPQSRPPPQTHPSAAPEEEGLKTLIARKRDGASLSAAEWSRIIAAYTSGTIPDYQMAALLMAVFANGLEPHEFTALTDAMLQSGARFPKGGHPPWIDKHSTGGVGDKVSLVLVPLMASCGVPVPTMAGRGLGHTGGTLDKLEAIPGFSTQLSMAAARAQMDRIGAFFMGATADIAPADRKLYALRDATGTIESIPLIAASIMSKKLAEGISGLVLDVKWGSGSFLPETDRAMELAKMMIEVGESRGCRCVALLTAMDRPLGRACGNALETAEAIAALRGEGPDDLMTVTYALGAEMLLLAGGAESAAGAHQILREAIGSGRAAEKFREMVDAQGGDPRVVDDPAILPRAPVEKILEANMDGYVRQVEPRIIGQAIVTMGGGRSAMDDAIDHAAGMVLSVKPGDVVEKGQPVARVAGRDVPTVERGLTALDRALRIGGERPSLTALISHRVTADGVAVVDH
ncbi:MAG: thymidine phosphorylase [Gemmatimonadetes bacterium]|nr:thymidine phosphorylase [Gemmatimonadota bacterium]